MGGIFWIAKMLLKVLKPFVKIAVIESLLEALMGVVGEEEDESETETQAQA